MELRSSAHGYDGETWRGMMENTWKNMENMWGNMGCYASTGRDFTNEYHNMMDNLIYNGKTTSPNGALSEAPDTDDAGPCRSVRVLAKAGTFQLQETLIFVGFRSIFPGHPLLHPGLFFWSSLR